MHCFGFIFIVNGGFKYENLYFKSNKVVNGFILYKLSSF